MRLDDGILLVVKACGSNPVGRTALQKLMYFASKLGVVEAEFSAHYYGPYSQQVANEVASLVDLDFLDECSGFMYASGNTGYSYRLTDDGQKVLTDANGHKAAIEKVVSFAVSHFALNPQLLATAAKVHFILEKSGEPLVPQKIREKAGHLGWDIDEQGIVKVIDYLKELGLANTGS
jgi:uncharacterized protein YwgA